MLEALEGLNQQVRRLREQGEKLREEARHVDKRTVDKLQQHYHEWYTQARLLIERHVPETANDFHLLYDCKGRHGARDVMSFFNAPFHLPSRDIQKSNLDGFIAAFSAQIGILASLPAVVELRSFDIHRLLSVKLLDQLISKATSLVEGNRLPEAAILGSFALGQYLLLIAEVHGRDLPAEEVGLSALNELLQEVYGSSTYLSVKWVADVLEPPPIGEAPAPDAHRVREALEEVRTILHRVA